MQAYAPTVAASPTGSPGVIELMPRDTDGKVQKPELCKRARFIPKTPMVSLD